MPRDMEQVLNSIVLIRCPFRGPFSCFYRFENRRVNLLAGLAYTSYDISPRWTFSLGGIFYLRVREKSFGRQNIRYFDFTIGGLRFFDVRYFAEEKCPKASLHAFYLNHGYVNIINYIESTFVAIKENDKKNITFFFTLNK